MASQVRLKYRFKKPVVFLGLILLVTILMYCSDSTQNSNTDFHYDNHADSVAYVGMKTCATCHQDKHQTFIHTGMGLSFDSATRQKSSAVFGVSHQVYDSFSDMHYYPFWNNEKLYIKEYRLLGKDTTHQFTQEINYIVGSGQHTNSHLMERNGYIYQAPITFYVQKQKWDLAPGFEGGNNSRFSRILNSECISCHNSMPKLEDNSQYKFMSMGNGIDCERCHGPGELHVKQRLNGQGVDVQNEIDPTIVNPRKLSWNRQIDLCQRCHLQGLNLLKEGKKFTDFKPGMKLSDIFEIYLPEYEGNQSQFDMANHSQRFQMSKCFTSTNNSDLKFTCISCHNPHVSVKITGTEVYNTACDQCHVKKDCSTSTDQLIEAKYNCVSCHMPPSSSEDIPHVSVHDHYIRKPKENQYDVDQMQKLVGLYAVNNSQPTIEREILAYLEYWEKFDKNPFYINKAKELLVKNDFPKLWLKYYYLKEEYEKVIELKFEYGELDAWQNFMMGESYARTNQLSQAFFHTNNAYKLEPTNQLFGVQLLKRYVDNESLNEGEKLGIKLLGNFSGNAQILNSLAKIATIKKQYAKAKKYVNKAYLFDPDDISIWLTYLNLSVQLGEVDDAKKWLEKIQQKQPDFIQSDRVAKILDSL
ncbi:MAG: tetratricopeptide repeat protein [Bacteroidota bacterium]